MDNAGISFLWLSMFTYATVAFTDNFVACEGSLLRKIVESLLRNENLNKEFAVEWALVGCQSADVIGSWWKYVQVNNKKLADLCDAAAESFVPSNISDCLIFLVVFEQARSKDFALKYKGNLNKGKMLLALDIMFLSWLKKRHQTTINRESFATYSG